MRIPSHHSVRLARALVVTSLFALAACAGGSGSSTLPNPGSNALCDSNNTAGIQLARPFPGQGGVSTGTTTIEIVDGQGNDQLHDSTSQFDLNLRDNFNNLIASGTLTAVPDTTGPHPFTNDFYYAASIGGLQPGQVYTVFLNAPNTNCTPGQVGQFST